jgi:hypothetical protein
MPIVIAADVTKGETTLDSATCAFRIRIRALANTSAMIELNQALKILEDFLEVTSRLLRNRSSLEF